MSNFSTQFRSTNFEEAVSGCSDPGWSPQRLMCHKPGELGGRTNTNIDGVGPNDGPLALLLLLLFRLCLWLHGETDGMDFGSEAAASPHKRHIHVSVRSYWTHRWTWRPQGSNQKDVWTLEQRGGGTSSLLYSSTRLARWLTVVQQERARREESGSFLCH